MHRILFEKVGDGVFLSHLDLIRLFQRAFCRGGLMLKHSQGFSPKPYVSVALPLSVGTHSVCEIMDFELEDGAAVPENLPEKLNRTLPEGIRVLRVYDSERKIKELTYLSAKIILEYDHGVPCGAADELKKLFDRDEIMVEKHSKNGAVETNIRPMIRELDVVSASAGELEIRCVVCAQNPALNPMLLVTAIEKYLPQIQPDFAYCCRLDVLDEQGKTFR